MQCGKDNYDDFQTIRNYLNRVGNASAAAIERDTGVPKRIIQYFFQDEFLEIPTSSAIRVPCQKCGAPIRTGRFCEDCKKKETEKPKSEGKASWHTLW
jgi:hypothetical protein